MILGYIFWKKYALLLFSLDTIEQTQADLVSES